MAGKEGESQGKLWPDEATRTFIFIVGVNSTALFGELQNFEGNQTSLQYDFGKLKQHFMLTSGSMKMLSSKTIPVWAYTEKNGFRLFRVHVCQIG